MAPDTLLMHVLQQTDKLSRVEANVKNASTLLSGDTLTFLETNLLAQHKIMYGLSLWLELLLKAQLALEEGNLQAGASHLSQAQAHFSLIREGQALGSRGEKWEQWYRGDRKMNLDAAEALTAEMKQWVQKDI
jgi:hypothetical protein